MADPVARRSLRRELLVVLLASVAAAWVATAIVSYVDARHELDELLDAHLAQSASLLIAQSGREPEEIDVEHSPQLHPYGRRVAFQIWENGTVLRLHSANAPNAQLSPDTDGFSDARTEGVRWRLPMSRRRPSPRRSRSKSATARPSPCRETHGCWASCSATSSTMRCATVLPGHRCASASAKPQARPS